MAESKCPKCNHTKFELKAHRLGTGGYSYNLVQCASCGTVVGVVDDRNIPHMLGMILKHLEDIESRLK